MDGAESPQKRWQLIFSEAVLLVELCLLPLLLLALVFSATLSRLIAKYGFDPNGLANIWFLQDQSALFAARGAEPYTIINHLQVFGAFVWISVSIALLRLLSGPLLFDLMDARDAVRSRRIPSPPPGKLLLGWLAAGPVAIWASMYGSDSAPQLAFLLRHSPQAYIGLEAFVFVTGTIFLAEGLLFCIRPLFKRWRSRASTPNDATARPGLAKSG